MLEKYLTGIQHIGLPTYDIDKTISFYNSLGFRVIYKTVNKNDNSRVAFLELGNFQIETYENLNEPVATGAINHISLNTTDIKATFEEILKGGYKMLDRSIQTLPFFEAGVRFFNIEGPNNEIIEFCQKL